MKKYFTFLLFIVMLFAFSACGVNSADNKETTASKNTSSVSEKESSSKATADSNGNNDSNNDSLDTVIEQDMNDVTKADGSVNETIIGTTVSSKEKTTGKKPSGGSKTEKTTSTTTTTATATSEPFETDIIPIG